MLRQFSVAGNEDQEEEKDEVIDANEYVDMNDEQILEQVKTGIQKVQA